MRRLDFSRYTPLPRLTLDEVLHLVDELIRVAPEQDPGGQEISSRLARSLRDLMVTRDDARRSWAERERMEKETSDLPGRATDVRADNAWYTLRDLLRAWSRVDGERYPKARIAARVEQSLVGDEGWEFLRLPHHRQFQHMKMLLGRIESEGLEADIAELAPPEVLQEIREAFRSYDTYQQRTLRFAGPRADLLERLRGLRQAASVYVYRLLNEVEDFEDERAIQWVERALVAIPLSARRTRRAPTRGAEGDEEPLPEGPVDGREALDAAPGEADASGDEAVAAPWEEKRSEGAEPTIERVTVTI